MSKWYLYEDDEVIGPFTEDQLEDRIEANTLVCKAGSEDWQKAETVDALEPLLFPSDTINQAEPQHEVATEEPTVESDEPDQDSSEGGQLENEELIEPTIEKLRSICERAENDELLAEYDKHWDEYDAEERRVILEEIENRGIMDSS